MRGYGSVVLAGNVQQFFTDFTDSAHIATPRFGIAGSFNSPDPNKSLTLQSDGFAFFHGRPIHGASQLVWFERYLQNYSILSYIAYIIE